VKIFSTTAQYKAELIKGLLLENSIESVVINKQDSSYLFGELELYVKTDDAILAKHLITIQEQE